MSIIGVKMYKRGRHTADQRMQRQLVSAVASARPRVCVTISRTPLWHVSKDAKHHISGILSRIRKGSLRISKI